MRYYWGALDYGLAFTNIKELVLNLLGVIVVWLRRKMLFFTALYWSFGINCHDVHNFIYSTSDCHENPIERALLNRRNLRRVRVMAKRPFVSLYWCNCFESGIFSQILNKPTLKNYHIMCKKEMFILFLGPKPAQSLTPSHFFTLNITIVYNKNCFYILM